MNRVELLEAASMKLAEAVLLLTEAGEQPRATSAGELAEIIEFAHGLWVAPTRSVAESSIWKSPAPAVNLAALAWSARVSSPAAASA